MSFEFQINERFFRLPSLGETTHMTVQSVPRPYGVRWTEASATDAIQQALEAVPGSVLVIDERLRKLNGPALRIDGNRVFTLSATEATKTLDDGVVPLVDFFMRHQITKSHRIVVVGGGIVQDVAAFAAAMYRRGVPWALLPTTLLAMSDSCIGGKAALNHGGAKNHLGLFSSPHDVIISPAFLQTLPAREVRAGLGEILKLHITAGCDALDRYEEVLSAQHLDSLPVTALQPLLLGALDIKRAVIEHDEFELDLRRALNYGHTVGHVVEALSGYRIPHGHAVVIGMLTVNRIAAERGVLAEAPRARIERLGQQLLDDETRAVLRGLPASRITDLLQLDKKTTGRLVNFIFLERIGRLVFTKIENNASLAQLIGTTMREIAG